MFRKAWIERRRALSGPLGPGDAECSLLGVIIESAPFQRLIEGALDAALDGVRGAGLTESYVSRFWSESLRVGGPGACPIVVHSTI